MTAEAKAETRQFQAEVQQILNLMINALYSNKEIFLREAISNASDACDKLRFAALKDNSLYGDDSELRIEVSFDKDARTVSVRDNGIGMSREDVIENIGTIARSGTRRFLEQLTGDQKQDAQLIGQFGVGFYSAFIVADRVTVRTRRADLGPEEGVQWESDGGGEYTIETVELPERGTEVTLHLREGEDEFLERPRLRSIINKYSDHIGFPIKMPKVKADEESEDEEASTEAEEWEVVNQASALWTRPRAEISDDEYKAFYKHVAHDFNDPLTWAHNHVEGKQSYTSLLYIPSQAPFDLWMTGREERRGIRLYVRRVFIMDAAEHLVPYYLRFVRGVVDSDDLPLNISREILQSNELVDKIRSACVKRTLDLLEKTAKDDPEGYQNFWDQFGQVLKEGPAEDFNNRERIAKLLRFASTHNDTQEQTVSLDDYIERMQPDQEKIYYVTADSFQAAKNSPHLEVFRKKGIEVLLLYDRIDEWTMGYLTEYEGKKLQSVAKGEIDVGELEDESDKAEREKAEEEAKPILERMKEVLGEEVSDVRVSHRLTESPSCLVLSEHEMAVHMQKLLKQAGHEIPGSKPTLEINPGHPLVKRLEHEGDDQRFANWTRLLYEQAVLSESGQLEDPAGFVHRLNDMLLAVEGGGGNQSGGGGKQTNANEAGSSQGTGGKSQGKGGKGGETQKGDEGEGAQEASGG